nr:hypothetical protein I308_00054 [Cryptococcus tetragattii IND107]
MEIQSQGERRLKLITPKDVAASLRTLTVTVQTPQGAIHKKRQRKREKRRGK